MSKIKFLFILVFTLLCFQLVGAEDWLKFDNVKQYDSATQTVSIVNTFGIGKTLVEIKLDTPIKNEVGFGGVFKVAEIQIKTYEEYSNILNEMKFINMRNGLEITREFEYKYKTTEEVDVNDYKEVCSTDLKNGTFGDCKREIVGTHKETKEVWLPLEKTTFLKDEVITIGIYTYVEKGDYIEWIPTYFNKEITEWAYWIASLNDGNVAYYSFDEKTGTNMQNNATKNLAGWTGNGTMNNSGTVGAVGKLGWGISLNNTLGEDQAVTVIMATPTSALSVCGWIKSLSLGGQKAIVGAYDKWQITQRPATTYNDAVYVNLGVAMQGTTNTSNNAWHHFCVTWQDSDNNESLYVDGKIEDTDSKDGALVSNLGFAIGAWDYDLEGVDQEFTGFIDEIGMWNKSLTNAEVTTLYNGGLGIVYGSAPSGPTVTLQAPIDYYNSTTPDMTFDVDVTDESYVENVSFYMDGSFLEVDITHVNGTYLFNATSLVEGFHNWSIEAWNNNSVQTNSSTRYFWVNTTPLLTLTAPDNNANLSYHNVSFNATVYSVYDIANVSLYINGTINATYTTGVNGSYTFPQYLGDNYYSWYIEAYSSRGGLNQTSTRYLTIDTTPPVITIDYPANTTYITNITTVNNIFIDFNWTTTDLFLDKCWYSNDSGVTNTTVTCDGNFSYYESYGQKTFFAGANDTLNNNASAKRTATWIYQIFENSRSVPTTAMEGSTQTFTLNISNPSYPLTSAYLNFNGTRYTANINTGTYTTLTSSFIIPAVTSDDNDTILWELFIAEGGINTTASYMNLTDINIDDCSVNNIILYNFTIVDEINQDKLNETKDNTSGKINLQIYPFGSTTLFLNYSTLFNMTNPFSVCLNDSLGSDNFSIDAEIEYDAYTNTKEYYHFQNDTLNTAYLYKNISLYDLNDSYAYTFKISYKDDSGVPVDDALIEVWRKYVDEGVFKISEIAKTDSDGETQAKLQLNDVIYNFVVKKNGVTLDSFNNRFVRCDNYLYSICEIKLNSFSSYPTTTDYTIGEDFEFTLVYNRTTRVISSAFNIPSGASSLVVLNATLLDNLGTTLACSDSTTSSSGTLTCLVPNAIGNGSVYAQLFKGGVYQASGTIKLERSPSATYGTSLVFLLLFLYLTLIGMAVGDSPMVAGLFLILGAILGILLNFVASSGFVGAGATILWFIIAVVIMLIKGGKRT